MNINTPAALYFASMLLNLIIMLYILHHHNKVRQALPKRVDETALIMSILLSPLMVIGYIILGGFALTKKWLHL